MDGDLLAMEVDQSNEKTALIKKRRHLQEPNSGPLNVLYLIRLSSAEIVVFCFVFVFYYYQYYTQQYLVQWYTIKALENATSESFSNLSMVCYNQTLMNELSGSNSTFDEVEEQAAHTTLMVTLAKYLPSLLINLIISPLSDKYGRKPALIMVMLGEALAIVLSVIATYLVLDIYWFILCGFLLGFSGGVSTLMSVSFAYISDITPAKWRTLHLGFLQAVIYIATATSAGVFNVWLQDTNCDFRPPSWLMFVIVLAGLLYAILMPESLSRNKRVRLNESKKGFTVIVRGLQIFFWPRLGYCLWRLWFLVLCIVLVVFGESGETAITTLFLLHKPLEWKRSLIGVYGIVRSVSHAVALFVFLPLFSFLKFPEAVTVTIGVLLTVGANVFLGFVRHTWEMFVVGLLQGVESLMLPALLGMISKMIHQEDQGAVFSISSTFSLLAALFGSMAYSLVYPFSLKHGLPAGSSYWLMAIIGTFVLPLVLLAWLLQWRNPSKNATNYVVAGHSKDNHLNQE